MIVVRPVSGLPEITAGDDLARLILEAGGSPEDGDVVVVSQKAVSKAEGRTVELSSVSPGARANALAAEHGHDPRAVQVVLDESIELLRAERGVLISRTRQGFVCANAGVDASNAGAEDRLVLLPHDPDGSARELRTALGRRSGRRPAVVIADSFGRTWRHGQCDVAIGCAGLAPLEDWRGRPDADGRELRATWIAVADQAAAAADLARDKVSRQPAAIISGLERHVAPDDGPGAAALVRPPAEDLFR
ncbi:MAG: coenzyme F420-0:L-glutamate ligase [Actinobacteria bacterium]|nr:MAG: coenzyme F420-0:L-glutamate ligase [Actinomycetota bacterium]